MSKKKLIWKTEKRKIEDLKLFENNPRKLSKKQAEELLKSLKKFNLVEIPAIDHKNRVLAGNMRIQALKKLGRENDEIEVRVPSRPLTEQEAKEYLLRSNRNVGEWDFNLLGTFDEDFLKDVGFEEKDLKKIFKTSDEIKGEVPWLESKNFFWFVEKYSILCDDFGFKLWGVNVNPDKQSYSENVPFSTLSYVGSPFTAVLKGNECWYDEKLPLKEDYDMTLQQINKYRGVLRVNKFFYVVRQSEQAGG